MAKVRSTLAISEEARDQLRRNPLISTPKKAVKITLDELHQELMRLRERVEDLRELNASVVRNQGKKMIPLEAAWHQDRERSRATFATERAKSRQRRAPVLWRFAMTITLGEWVEYLPTMFALEKSGRGLLQSKTSRHS